MFVLACTAVHVCVLDGRLSVNVCVHASELCMCIMFVNYCIQHVCVFGGWGHLHA